MSQSPKKNYFTEKCKRYDKICLKKMEWKTNSHSNSHSHSHSNSYQWKTTQNVSNVIKLSRRFETTFFKNMYILHFAFWIISLENGMDKANQPTRQHNVINSLYTPLWLWLWPWLWLWLRLSGSGSGPGSSSGSGSSRALQQTFHRWPFQKLKIRNAYVFCKFPKMFFRAFSLDNIFVKARFEMYDSITSRATIKHSIKWNMYKLDSILSRKKNGS